MSKFGTCQRSGCKEIASKTCSRCSNRQYCSQACQKGDWEEHFYECCANSPPVSFDGLRQNRPRVANPAEFEALMDEIKRTYYPRAMSNLKSEPEAIHKNGVAQGYIVVKSGKPDAMLSDFTARELNTHMILFLTKRRQRLKRRFCEWIGGKADADGSHTFGAELAPKVSACFYQEFSPQYNGARHVRHQFDLLYGFTTAIYQFWFWMQRHPPDWIGHAMLRDLGDMWRTMLDRGPEELGLDPVFSYPGMRQLMRHFKRDLEEEVCYCSQPLRFDFE